jgi:hypothetical protein
MLESQNKINFAGAPRWHGTLAWLAVFICCALALTSQSLWIDETYTALKAQQTTLPNWWHELRRVSGSDVQMPLYMIWIWVCEKFFGSSEIALRAVNLFWILPGLIALWVALARQPRLQLAVFWSPFLARSSGIIWTKPDLMQCRLAPVFFSPQHFIAGVKKQFLQRPANQSGSGVLSSRFPVRACWE